MNVRFGRRVAAWILLPVIFSLFPFWLSACAPPPLLGVDSNSPYTFAGLIPNLDKSDVKSFTVTNKGGRELVGTIYSDKNGLHLDTNAINISKGTLNVTFWVNTRGMDYESSGSGSIQIKTNGGDASIAVNLSTKQEPLPARVDTINIGLNPQYVWVNQENNRIYVYLDQGFTTLAKLKLSSPTGDAAIHPTAPTLCIIDGNTDKDLCKLSGLLINFAYYNGIANLHRLDCDGKVPVGSYSNPAPPAMDRIMPTLKFQYYFLQVEANSGFTRMINQIPVGALDISDTNFDSDPTVTTVNPIMNRTYTADPGNSSISVTDSNTGTLIATVKVGKNPVAIAVNPETKRIYVANRGDDTVSVINGDTDRVLANIAVGREPVDIAINPGTKRIYVANCSDFTVTVLEDDYTR